MLGQGPCHAQCSALYQQLHDPVNINFRADIQSAYTNCCSQQQNTASAGIKASAAAPSGISAGEVLTGIGAILAPIAQAGVGIYAAQQQAKLAKLQLKQQQAVPISAPVFLPPTTQSSSMPLILGGVVVLLVIGGMFIMMRGGGAQVAATNNVAGGSSTAAPTASAPRLVKVKRVRKRRRRRPRSKK